MWMFALCLHVSLQFWCLSFMQKSNSRIPTETQGSFFTMNSHITQGKHFLLYSGEQGDGKKKKGQTKVKVKAKPSRTDINSFASIPSIWDTWNLLDHSKRGQPRPAGFPAWGPHGISLGLTPLGAGIFPQQKFHIFSIWRLHCGLDFILKGSLIALRGTPKRSLLAS